MRRRPFRLRGKAPTRRIQFLFCGSASSRHPFVLVGREAVWRCSQPHGIVVAHFYSAGGVDAAACCFEAFVFFGAPVLSAGKELSSTMTVSSTVNVPPSGTK